MSGKDWQKVREGDWQCYIYIYSVVAQGERSRPIAKWFKLMARRELFPWAIRKFISYRSQETDSVIYSTWTISPTSNRFLRAVRERRREREEKWTFPHGRCFWLVIVVHCGIPMWTLLVIYRIEFMVNTHEFDSFEFLLERCDFRGIKYKNKQTNNWYKKKKN